MQELYRLSQEGLLCSQNNQAFFACCSQSCQKSGLMCMEKQCQCKIIHQQCFTLQLKFLIAKLNGAKKQIPQDMKKAFQSLQIFLDDIIQKLSFTKQKLIQRISFYGFEAKQTYLYNLIQTCKLNQISGSLLSQVLEQFNCTFKQDNNFSFSVNLINQTIKQEKVRFQEMNTQIEISFDYAGNQMKKIKSKINIHQEILLDWITPQIQNPIKKLNLIYRASENKFSNQAFHQKCDRILNTLVVAKTEKGKILGGYNPSVWSNKQNKGLNDNCQNAFIFSLSLRQKVKAKQKSYYSPIYWIKDGGPSFHDIRFDGNKCYVSLFESYQKQSNNNVQTCKKWIGTQQPFCKLQELQVFQIIV